MPELPEVEVIRKSLQGVIGKTITAIYFSKVAPIETTTARAIRPISCSAATSGRFGIRS